MIAIDWTISLGNLISLALLIAGGVGVYVALIRSQDRAATEAAAAKARADEAHDIAHAAARDLAAYMITVERTFATAASLAAVEGRIVGAIEKLGDRIDRLMSSRGA